jgi:Trypsin
MKNFSVLILTVLLIQSCQSKKDSNTFHDKSNKSNISYGGLLAEDQLPQMSQLNSKNSSCSATLVGPNVILTAAHCVGDSADQVFGPLKGAYYKVKLTIHPDYTEEQDKGSLALASDIAIGVLEQEIPNITPITVSIENPFLNRRVIMAGCGRPTNGIRQLGFSNISQLGKTGFTLVAGFQTLDHGDSGGPSLIVNDQDEISLFAVNSTGDLFLYQGVSSVVNHPANENADFITQFISDQHLKVCGFNFECQKINFISEEISQAKNYKTELNFNVDNSEVRQLKQKEIGNNAILKKSVTGLLIYADLGKSEDFINLDAKDKIVLVSR